MKASALIPVIEGISERVLPDGRGGFPRSDRHTRRRGARGYLQRPGNLEPALSQLAVRRREGHGDPQGACRTRSGGTIVNMAAGIGERAVPQVPAIGRSMERAAHGSCLCLVRRATHSLQSEPHAKALPSDPAGRAGAHRRFVHHHRGNHLRGCTAGRHTNCDPLWWRARSSPSAALMSFRKVSACAHGARGLMRSLSDPKPAGGQLSREWLSVRSASDSA